MHAAFYASSKFSHAFKFHPCSIFSMGYDVPMLAGEPRPTSFSGLASFQSKIDVKATRVGVI